MQLSEVPGKDALQARRQEAKKPTRFPFRKASLRLSMSLKAQSTCYPMRPCKKCAAQTGKRRAMYPLAAAAFLLRKARRHRLVIYYMKNHISE